MKKPKFREVMQLAPSHTARKRQGQNVIPNLVTVSQPFPSSVARGLGSSLLLFPALASLPFPQESRLSDTQMPREGISVG